MSIEKSMSLLGLKHNNYYQSIIESRTNTISTDPADRMYTERNNSISLIETN
jgi:hypothetical protein